jgi:hypothetical protein
MTEDTWTEVKVTSDGVSVTVYEETEDDSVPTVVDEFWMTHDELENASNNGKYVLGES